MKIRQQMNQRYTSQLIEGYICLVRYNKDGNRLFIDI